MSSGPGSAVTWWEERSSGYPQPLGSAQVQEGTGGGGVGGAGGSARTLPDLTYRALLLRFCIWLSRLQLPTGHCKGRAESAQPRRRVERMVELGAGAQERLWTHRWGSPGHWVWEHKQRSGEDPQSLSWGGSETGSESSEPGWRCTDRVGKLRRFGPSKLLNTHTNKTVITVLTRNQNPELL